MAGVITAILGIKNAQFKAGLNESKQDAAQFKNDVGGIFSGLGKTIAGAFTIGAVVSAVKSLVDFTGEIQDQADALGVSVEELQRYGQAMAQSGVNSETFAKGLESLTQAMADALGGDQGKVEAFADLGIALADIAANANTPARLLPMIADGFAKATNRAQAFADVSDVLGKAGKKMVAGFGEGGEGLQKLAASFAVISAENAKNIADFGDAWGAAFDQVKAAAGEKLGWVLGKIREVAHFGSGGRPLPPTPPYLEDAPAGFVDPSRFREQQDQQVKDRAEALKKMADAERDLDIDLAASRRKELDKQIQEGNAAFIKQQEARKTAELQRIADAHAAAMQALALEAEAAANTRQGFIDDKLAGPDAVRARRRREADEKRAGHQFDERQKRAARGGRAAADMPQGPLADRLRPRMADMVPAPPIIGLPPALAMLFDHQLKELKEIRSKLEMTK